MAVASTLVLASGCKGKEKVEEGAGSASPPTAAPAPAPASKPTESSGTVTLAAGESYAEMRPNSKNPVAWTVSGQTVQIAIVASGDNARVRAYTGEQPLDLTGPHPVYQTTYDMRLVKDGVRVQRNRLAGRVAGVGALLEYEHWLVTWDDATKKPVVSSTWKCNETTAKNGDCAGPAWTRDDAGSAD